MIILGVDPGYHRCGFAVLETKKNQQKLLDYGVICTNSTDDFSDRLEEIVIDFETLIKKHKPDLVVIEDLFFVKNITTGLKVSEVVGVLRYTAKKEKIPVQQPKPVEVKSAFCGDGHADKKQMLRMAQKIFKLESEPHLDDAADAIAVAYWGSITKTYEF